MRRSLPALLVLLSALPGALAQDSIPPFPHDPDQNLERTCFQTGRAYTNIANLRSDVAIVYGIDAGLPKRIESWRDRGYRIHVMTGVAWGNYQDYLYGRFDGINHEDEAQTERNGNKISHGGDVYYMSPGTNYGKFLCVGVQRALDAGARAIHLEEPEFWVRGGYSEGFKREWKNYYGEDWQPPHSSEDAQWRSSKLKYFLYRRALQQVFDYVQAYNKRTGSDVHCYVPTHSLLNYASWRIVSPESSLARLNGCDGYIAQVWTGTARTPNIYRGAERERTFETAFLEYGAMQNLVRATGRRVWYLNDPIEDNPNHDWNDYRFNWECTLTASLFQPEVWHYEVAPWPERIFGGRYPRNVPPDQRQPIPPAYATELQVVMNALNDMNQKDVKWDCGTTGIGVIIGDSLMFERGDPNPSDSHLDQIYGMAMPLLKRGMPVAPVQLENLTVPDYLKGFRVLLLTYEGMKPLSPDVHAPLADWVKSGGLLVVCDDDRDPYNKVREWWNSDGNHYATPREALFEKFELTNEKLADAKAGKLVAIGKGGVIWLQKNPADLARSKDGDVEIAQVVKEAASRAGLTWNEENHLLLRRGPYIIAAGLDESVPGDSKVLHGKFVNLFDSELRVQDSITLAPRTRFFLLDLDAIDTTGPRVLASGCKTLPKEISSENALTLTVEGVANTHAVVLLKSSEAPKGENGITLDNKPVKTFEYSAKDKLLWIHFPNEARPRDLTVRF